MANPTPIHAHNNPLQDLASMRRKLERKGTFKEQADTFLPLEASMRKMWEDIENVYRLFREETEVRTARGGGGGSLSTGGAAAPEEVEKPVRALGFITFGNSPYPLGFNADGNAWSPVEPIHWRLWNDTNQRFYIPSYEECEIVEISGNIWIQDEDNQPQQFLVKLQYEGGDQFVEPNRLLGFDVGFLRFDSKRGHMFLDVFQYPPDSTTNTVNDIPVESAKYVSTIRVLDDYYLSEYDMESGGRGLKFYCNLTVFVK